MDDHPDDHTKWREYPWSAESRCTVRTTFCKSPGLSSQHERCFSACRTAVRRYLRPARAGSAAAITSSAPVLLHVSFASTQLGAHRRPACTKQRVRHRY